jgi:hypothetical protein
MVGAAGVTMAVPATDFGKGCIRAVGNKDRSVSFHAIVLPYVVDSTHSSSAKPLSSK